MSEATNLKDTIIPKSDQLNADQLLSAPMTILESCLYPLIRGFLFSWN